MALACAGLLGYRLAWNFDFPYLAADISQFWRRWHMSLSSWLRDYLYIPLGGNRGGRWFIARNLHDHDAARRPVARGGVAFRVLGRAARAGAGGPPGMERPLARPCTPRRPRPGRRWRTAAPGTLLTFYWVCVCWVFFRAPDLPSAWAVLRPFVFWQADGTATAARARGHGWCSSLTLALDPLDQPAANVRRALGNGCRIGRSRRRTASRSAWCCCSCRSITRRSSTSSSERARGPATSSARRSRAWRGRYMGYRLAAALDPIARGHGTGTVIT